MFDDKPTEERYQNGVNGHGKVGARRGGRIGNICRRFWWLCVLILIIVVLIIVLPVIFVAFPNKAQSDVDDSTIEIVSLQVVNPTANSVHMIQDAVISSNSSFHPFLDAFNVSIGLQGSNPYTSMLLPGTTSGSSVPVHVDQTVDIWDMDAFKDYNVALQREESITQVINGSTWLHEGSLPADQIQYNKQVHLTGFNSLKGFNLTRFHVLDKDQPDGSNAVGNVLIPNPTVLTIDMGNVTFDIYVPTSKNGSSDMTRIGNSTIPNFVFKPGNNTYNMTSVVDKLAVLGLVQATYKDFILPLTIVGNTSVYNGVVLPYYVAALKAANLTATVNVTESLQANS